MTDEGFPAFFAEVCARLGLAPTGYRRTLGSVRKRVARRMRELGVAGLVGYRRHLAQQPEEWGWLDRACRIPISRFARDAPVYDALVRRLLPEQAAIARARRRRSVRVWSAGSASGEEPYGLAIAWRLELQPRFPELELAVLATDADPVVLARAARASYPGGSLRELPARFRAAFQRRGDEWWLAEPYRAGVRFQRADLRSERPDGPFDLVLCRNLAFTYFDLPTQRRVASAFAAVLRPGGLLVVGRGEQLPPGCLELRRREPELYVRDDGPAPGVSPAA